MDFTAYMSEAIHQIVMEALRASVKNPRETAFLLKYKVSQKKSAQRRHDMEARGIHVPPFMIASIASQCNLHCAGCYARANHACSDHQMPGELDADRWNEIFREASNLGVAFILLAGGEPLIRMDVLRKASDYPNIIFPIFTNGTMIDPAALDLFQRKRNLLPVLSIEGDQSVTDCRRGGGTFVKLMTAMEEMERRMILFGVSLTATKQNIPLISSREFIGMLQQKGCKIAFFIEYVPADGSNALAPGDQDRLLLSSNINMLRSHYGNMIFLSFPGDEENLGGCLAAGKGFFHINPFGAAEPCPFSPFSDTNLTNCTLLQALSSPLFKIIRSQDFLNQKHDGGCVLFAQESKIREMIAR
ncbi:MAG: radical SAM/SPASM domain-containing protein [Christensenellales bacterium]